MGIIDTGDQAAAALAHPLWDDNLARVGGVTRIYARRHRARRLLLRRDQRLGRRRAADQRHRGRLPAQRGAATRRPAAVDLPALRQHLLGRHHRGGGLPRRPLRLHRVADRPTTRGPASTTSATAPARAWPATASATRSSAATTSPPSPGHRQGARVEPAARTPSRATRPWRPPRAACSSAATACSRAGSHRTRRVLRLQHRAVPPAAPDTTITDPDRGPGRRQQRAVHGHRHGHVATGSVGRVAGADPGPRQQPVPPDDLTTWASTSNTLNATLAAPGTTRPTWTLPATVIDHQPQPARLARLHRANGGTATDQATKKFESFSTDDQTPDHDASPGRPSDPDVDHLHRDRHGADDKGVNSLRSGSVTTRTATCRTTAP